MNVGLNFLIKGLKRSKRITEYMSKGRGIISSSALYRACKIMCLSRDTFYWYKAAVDNGGIDALIDKNRLASPNIKNRVEETAEAAVIAYAVEQPAYGQVRASNELRKQGIFISPSGVRCVWLRHQLGRFKDRLRALEDKMAREGLILTEAQVQVLEKKKKMISPLAKLKPRIPVTWALRIPFMSARSKVWGGFTSRLLSTPIPRLLLPNYIPLKHRLPPLIYSTTGCCRSLKGISYQCCGY